MPRFSFIFVFVILVLLPLKARSADWVKLGNIYIHEMIVKVYVDNDSDSKDLSPKGYKSLWVKFELPKNLESNIDKKEYRVREEKYHYHCGQKLFTVSHMILLDRDDQEVYNSGSFDPYDEDYGGSWKLITPKSGPALIYQYLCRDVDSSAKTADKPEEVSGKELIPSPIIIDEVNDNDKQVTDEPVELEIKDIRWAMHEGFERLVFDIYEGGSPVSKPKNYEVTKLEDKNTIKFSIAGLTSLSADIPDLEGSSALKKIYKMQYSDNKSKRGKIFLYIDIVDSTEFRTFQLEDPGRIVIDINAKEQ